MADKNKPTSQPGAKGGAPGKQTPASGAPVDKSGGKPSGGGKK